MKEGRRLFCELGPLAYRISVEKEIGKRRVRDFLSSDRLAGTKSAEKLPVLLKAHRSLIRRRLYNVDLQLQENKAVNLGLAAREVTGILIRPGETFSFWSLVGRPTARRGFLPGLTIQNGETSSGIGGGMCQFTNLLHWMVLHTDLEIVEHHHHNHFDLFPDFKRQIPFGTGTSVVYNYLDYRFRNGTDNTYQLLTWTDDVYLCGEIRATAPLKVGLHILEREGYFYFRDGVWFRHNKIYRKTVDKATGNTLEMRLLLENNARVLYDESLIDPHRVKGRDPRTGTAGPV